MGIVYSVDLTDTTDNYGPLIIKLPKKKLVFEKPFTLYNFQFMTVLQVDIIFLDVWIL